MLTSVEVIVDVNGQVLPSEPLKVSKKSRAILTILDDEVPEIDLETAEKERVDLRERNIGESEAAAQRQAFAAFAEDWDNPEMDVYDKL